MKTYRITVNNEVYTVTVEEVQPGGFPASGVAPSPSPTPVPAPAPLPTPVPTPAPQPKQTAAPAPASAAPKKVASAGEHPVQAPMPGKILALKVNAGDTVKRGTVLLVLEAMKMENDILAPVDGVIKTVNVIVGATVNTGEVLIVMD